jgi:hypothetical protein
MAQLPGFDPNTKPSDPDRASGSDVLPAGWYCFYIMNSEMRDNNSGSGTHLWVEFEIVESAHPDLKGRRTWARITYTNQNTKAVEIGRADLSAIAKAVGHTGPLTDTEVLHGKPLAVRLKVRPAKGDYPASNDPAGYDDPQIRFKDGVPQPHHAAGVTQNTAAPAPAAASAPTQAAPPPATAPLASPPPATAPEAAPAPVGDPTPSETAPWNRPAT